MRYLNTLLVLLCLTICACQEEQDCCILPEYEMSADQLLGIWQVHEYGYSPGDSYHTVEVSATPLQFLQFKENHEFSSNYQNLTDFKYFLVIEDNQLDNPVLVLYEALPSNDEEIDPNDLTQHSYQLVQTEQGLELWFRYCIEGCHIGIKRSS